MSHVDAAAVSPVRQAVANPSKALASEPNRARSSARHDDGGEPEPTFHRWTREEAEALRAREPALSPWVVVAAQVAVGVVAALVGWLITGNVAIAKSVLYGAACVVVPGALMARGMTSRLSSVSAGASAAAFMLWEMVKIAVSIVMLYMASRIVQPLHWLALLAGLVLGMKVYWVALLWRPRPKQN